MKLHIRAIGQGRGWTEDSLAREWFGKLPYQGQFLEFVSKKPQGTARTKDEGDRILASLPADCLLIAMDPQGQNISSEDLAAMIQKNRDNGCRDAVFTIGGADGHDRSVLAEAKLKLAFGVQTWPHMLFRAMLAEQLYRAEMIIKGHPYHHA